MKSMAFAYRCSACARDWGLDEPRFRCDCGGLLDLAPFAPRFSPREEASLFRYADALPYSEGSEPWRELSMGEGLTPLLRLDPADPGVLVKLDYAMPTLSFKDRGAVVVMAQAKAIGARRIVQDSSGNAGASVAAYAARAGLPCEIYLPASTSPRKIAQISAYGATVRAIPGSREDTAAAALEAASKGGAFYASHVYNPLFFQGTKTYLYEIYEALGGRLPEVLFVPLGNGTLFLGIHQGLRDLIAIAAPMRGAQILAAARELQAEIVLAPEAGIAPAKKALAARGLFVETTTAATFAAFEAWKTGGGVVAGRVVLPLCGAGLKSL